MQTQYLDTALDAERLSKAVSEAVEVLSAVDFDSIAFSGTSGAALAFPLAIALKKDVILVRKEDKNHHSDHLVEGPRHLNAPRFVIVDDFVASGATVTRIYDKIMDDTSDEAECVGMYLYNDFSSYVPRGLDSSKIKRISKPDRIPESQMSIPGFYV